MFNSPPLAKPLEMDAFVCENDISIRSSYFLCFGRLAISLVSSAKWPLVSRSTSVLSQTLFTLEFRFSISVIQLLAHFFSS